MLLSYERKCQLETVAVLLLSPGVTWPAAADHTHPSVYPPNRDTL